MKVNKMRIKRIGRIIFIFMLCCFALGNLYAAQDESVKKTVLSQEKPIEAVADSLEYVRGKKKIIAKGNVVVSYKNMRLIADYAEINTETKVAVAKGHVTVFQGPNKTLSGDTCVYNFENQTGSFPKGRAFSYPWYAFGQEINQVSKDKIVIEEGSISTCDRPDPHYTVHAKKVLFYPDDKIIAYNITVKILGKTVFWWPYLIVPIDVEDWPFQITPGYSSEYGWYVLTSKGITLTKNIKGRAHLDYRSKKGVGGGVDLHYDYGRFGSGEIKAYATQDDDKPDPTKDKPFEDREDESRGRFTLKHRTDFGDYTNLIVYWNELSDEYFLQDFFEREFRKEVQPRSFVLFTRNTENYGLYAEFRKRTNRFYTVLERLPEIRFDWNKKRLFNTNIYYESKTSFAVFNEKFARSALDHDVVRFDTFHEFSYPKRIKFLEFVPFINFRETYYSKNAFGKEHLTRFAYGQGIDVSTRFYKIWDDEGKFLGMDFNGVRHVLEPSIRYNSIREVSFSPSTLQHFDEIDEIDDLDQITFGIENRIQTKRMVGGRMQRIDVISYNTYLLYEFNEETIGGSKVTTLRQEIELRPYDWLAMEASADYDVDSDQFTSAEFDLVLEKEPLNLMVSHRFINDDSHLYSGSCQLAFDIEYKINELWKVGGFALIEFDDSQIEEWEIRAVRNLHCWELLFGYNVRKSERESTNKTFFVELTLKAFPKYPLKSGNRASFARPRIGRYVSGSNV